MTDYQFRCYEQSGRIYLRSRFNSKTLQKRSSGLKYNKRNIDLLESQVMASYNYLKTLTPGERNQKYGSSVIDLSLIWSRFLELKGETDHLPASSTGVTEFVFEALQQFPETHKNKTPGFCRISNQVYMHFSYYCSKVGLTNPRLADMNRAVLHGYDNYLSEDTDSFTWRGNLYNKKPLKSGTRKKHFGILQAIAKYSQGSVEVNPEIQKYSVTEINEKAKVLTWEEIQLIEKFEPSSRAEELTKDIFLFACYSGLRISKIMELKPGDIKDGFIHWVNTKTKSHQIVNTTIHKYSANIIRKNKGREKHSLFPYIAQQTLNITIKEICQTVGISDPEKVHNHTGRHTYNNLLYELGVESFIREEELGHAHSRTNEKVYTQIAPAQRQTMIVNYLDRVEEILHSRKLNVTNKYHDL